MNASSGKSGTASKERAQRPAKKRWWLIAAAAGVVLLFLMLGGEESPELSADEAEIERLKALPYLAWVPTDNIDANGVETLNPEKAAPGVNIYKSGNEPEAFLMSMSGEIVHAWSAAINPDDTWSNIELLDDGTLIAFLNYEQLVSLNWDSSINWISASMGFHHDLSTSADGNIYALSRSFDYLPELSLTHLVANDYITILNRNGDILKSLSVGKLFINSGLPVIDIDIGADYPPNTALKRFIRRMTSDSVYNTLLPAINQFEQIYEKMRPKDFLHTNTLKVLDEREAAASHPDFRPGQALICIRNQNLVAVVDLDSEEIIWSWGADELEHPHDPSVMANGNILIFDNGYRRQYSRIIELDPVSKEIVWEYRDNPPEDFYSETRGSSQELPNGNILIADSRNGRAFEITRSGEIVWEFFNPNLKQVGETTQRAAIFRMRRFTDRDDSRLSELPDTAWP